MSQDVVSQKPVEIFISYSHKDQHYAKKLCDALHIYNQLDGPGVRVWYDENLTPGEEWEDKIHRHLFSAQIILLLVSPDFFASEFCTQRELPAALGRTDALVVPVIIRRVAWWDRMPLAERMVLPTGGKSIDEWSNEDHYFQSVSESVFDVLHRLTGKAESTPKTNRWNPQQSSDAGVQPESPPRQSADSIENADLVRPSVPIVAPNRVGPDSVSSESEAPAKASKPEREALLTVVVCFVHRERRQKLLHLRKWFSELKDPPFDIRSIDFVECKRIEDASRRLFQESETTVLLLDGFEPGSAQLDEVFGSPEMQRRFDVIINTPEWTEHETQQHSTSDLQSHATVTSDTSLLFTLRDVLLRKCESSLIDDPQSASRTIDAQGLDATDLSASEMARSDADRPTDSGPRPPAVPATATIPSVFGQSVNASSLRIVSCFLHPERRQKKFLGLRKWKRNSKEPLFADQEIQITDSNSLEDGVNCVAENPDETILLLDGFEPGCQQLEELSASRQLSPFNVVINSPEWGQFQCQEPSASILQPRMTVTNDQTLLAGLRKALLRVRTQQFATASVLDTPDELAAFFELRYRVWSELGYLSEVKKHAEIAWELDYTDRTSLPLGIFSKADGKLLGAARLVRGLGEDYPEQIRVITSMLQKRGAENLLTNFQYPTSKAHPFDILGELDHFKQYYCDLVRSGIQKAEVSRVVVAPAYRKLGLGEVLVDTLSSLARISGINVLFLACHTKHADFYRRSQFEVVDGVEGNKFLTYHVPCTAMERRV